MNMPQFIEPHETPAPEDAAAFQEDMARSIAEANGIPIEQARHALDRVTQATEGAATIEEAAAAALAAAEQWDAEQRARACGCPPLQVCDDCARPPEPEPEHDQADAVPPMPAQAPPTPMFAGTYAIYDDGNGGVMLVVGQSTGEIVRKHIPASMIKMAERFGGAGSGLAGLFGGK